jgi:hypothetical protein
LHGGWLPRESLHLVGASIASVFYGTLLLLAPLALSTVGRQRWTGKCAALSYFSLIGFAFITIELVLIQLFIRIIGYPLYAVATVLTVMLAGAAVGSVNSQRVVQCRRWGIVLTGIVLAGVALIAALPLIGQLALAQPAPNASPSPARVLPLARFLRPATQYALPLPPAHRSEGDVE